MVNRKNVLSTMMKSVVAAGVVRVLWIVVGYSLCFGDSIHGFVGSGRRIVPDVLRCAEREKPSVVGFCVGTVVGLVGITPAAGYVAVPQSIFIGVVAAIIPNLAVHFKSTRTVLDDTLDVFPCHGIGGIVGMLMTGIFASKAVNAGGADGWAYGNPGFFLIQLKAMGIAVGYSFSVSWLIFKFVNFLVPLRVSHEEEEEGLDASQHDEKYTQALCWSPRGTD